MDRKTALTEELKKRVLSSGIDLIGVTSAKSFGIEGENKMFIEPQRIFKDAQSIIVAGFSVLNRLDIIPSKPGMPRGRFSYGYRSFMVMQQYCRKVITQFIKEKGFKVVSTMKTPAKMAAVRAGLGKYGKNAVVLTKKFGSWVMFETLITDAPLVYKDCLIEVSDCGNCDICLKICPTQAIYEPFRVNRAKCITEWLWGTFVPVNLREKQEDRLFGCGECLKACPKNKEIKHRIEYPVALEDVSDSLKLIPLATSDSDYFENVVSLFAKWAGKEAIQGNAIIALGNIGDPAAIDALEETLQHPKPQIRAYSAWALGRIGGKKVKSILERALSKEKNRKVIREIKDAPG
jgi:epoxyqueuosine reductase